MMSSRVDYGNPRTRVRCNKSPTPPVSPDADDEVFFNPQRNPSGRRDGISSSRGHGEAMSTCESSPRLSVTVGGDLPRYHARSLSFTSDDASSQEGGSPHVPGAGGKKRAARCASIVDGLLHEIYDQWHGGPARDSLDSDTTFTEYSGLSEAYGRTDLSLGIGRTQPRFNRSSLDSKTLSELQHMVSELQHSSCQVSARLVRELKRRDQRLAKLQKHCDFVTAIIQAASLKRRIDMRMKFSMQPLAGDDAFHQWHDAMKAVARLPLGIPAAFRKKVWLAMADNHLEKINIDWDKTLKFAFNERSNPDDDTLGMQIVKDLHRTGWSGFSGHENDEDRAVLKRVLLAYARWNKSVGYCQGFNVLAALILEVVQRSEGDALKVMILLIDHILPESYFANNLRALSVDMAVFRDLLRYKLPQLSRHLDHLQAAARDEATGANYEPPLTNVFTMQWFLTLFATCLPKETALRVCDSVFLEGSEILLRTAVAIWGKLQERILSVHSADEFYTIMGVLAQEMLDGDIIDADDLIKTIYTMAPFPFPQLNDLREKYTYNITPFTAAMATGRKSRTGSGLFSDDDDLDDEDIDNISCFTGILGPQTSPTKVRAPGVESELSTSSLDISKVGPGAYGTLQAPARSSSAYQERMSMDITGLKSQYKRLRERQKQAHIILAAASAKHQKQKSHQVTMAASIPPIETPVAVNHLFVGKKGMGSKNRKVTEAPRIAHFYPVSASTVVSGVPGQEKRTGAESVNGSFSRRRLSSDLSESNGSSSQRRMSSDLSVKKSEKAVSLTSSGNTVIAETTPKKHENESSDKLPRGEAIAKLSNGEATDKPPKGEATVNTEATVAKENLMIHKTDCETEHDDSGINTSLQEDNTINTTQSDSNEPHQIDPFTINPIKEEPNHNTVSPNIFDSTITTTLSDKSNISVSTADSGCKGDEGPCDSEHGGPSVTQQASVDIFIEDVDHCDDSAETNDTQFVLSDNELDALDEEVRDTMKLQETLENNNGKLKRPDVLMLNASPTAALDVESAPSAEYITKLTYQTHKSNQGSRSPNLNNVICQSLSVSPIPKPLSRSPSPHSPVSPGGAAKPFYPFAGRHVNHQKVKNGIRLGLYSPDLVPGTDNNNAKKSPSLTSISRAHINACLHRQYMAEVKQQARSAKQ